MAGRHFTASRSAVSLSAATGKTVVQVVAAANHAVKVWGLGVSFNGVSNTDEPALVQLVRQTDAGTATALTPVLKDDSIGDTLDSTAQHTATAEPTGSTVIWEAYCHPQTGLREFFNEKTCPVIGAGDRLGVKVTSPAAVDVTVHVDCEE